MAAVHDQCAEQRRIDAWVQPGLQVQSVDLDRSGSRAVSCTAGATLRLWVMSSMESSGGPAGCCYTFENPEGEKSTAAAVAAWCAERGEQAPSQISEAEGARISGDGRIVVRVSGVCLSVFVFGALRPLCVHRGGL
jgi:hypothetical protein